MTKDTVAQYNGLSACFFKNNIIIISMRITCFFPPTLFTHLNSTDKWIQNNDLFKQKTSTVVGIFPQLHVAGLEVRIFPVKATFTTRCGQNSKKEKEEKKKPTTPQKKHKRKTTQKNKNVNYMQDAILGFVILELKLIIGHLLSTKLSQTKLLFN